VRVPWWISLVALLAAQVAGWAQVQLGCEVLAAGGFKELQGKRVGLITNPSGVNRRGDLTLDVLRKARGVTLVALFAPEHGLYGHIQAGQQVTPGKDPKTGLPIHSLYGATRKPTAAMLKGLDALVYDLQDTGLRSYTFISTLGLAMEACGEAGIEFIVLDRPNPLGGDRVEGPRLEPRFRSFVSQWDVPYAYGLTCGELARMINGERWSKKPCRLTVVPLRGWSRSMVWRDTGLPWVPTSPNIPRADSPLYLGATGLLGEIGGTSGLTIGGLIQRPFECLAASWLNADALSQALAGRLPGVSFPPLRLSVSGRKYHGVEIKFTDPAHAPLVAINYHLLDAIRQTTGRNVLAEAVQSGKSLAMFDRVNGTDKIREAIQAGRSAAQIVRSWKAGEDAFRTQRQPYLLYTSGPAASSARGDKPSPTTSPAGSTVTPLPPPRPASPPAATPYHTVIVSRGDTLTKIAQDFGVSLNAIVEANPGTNIFKLKAGQKLRVPRPPPASRP
jgi:uncharacterized protein YbbC (DUF1343 family)